MRKRLVSLLISFGIIATPLTTYAEKVNLTEFCTLYAARASNALKGTEYGSIIDDLIGSVYVCTQLSDGYYASISGKTAIVSGDDLGIDSVSVSVDLSEEELNKTLCDLMYVVSALEYDSTYGVAGTTVSDTIIVENPTNAAKEILISHFQPILSDYIEGKLEVNDSNAHLMYSGNYTYYFSINEVEGKTYLSVDAEYEQ